MQADKVLTIPGLEGQRANILRIDGQQLNDLENQGQQISGDITTAYLSLLSRSSLLTEPPVLSCRFTSDFVWTNVKQSSTRLGSWDTCWTAIHKRREQGNKSAKSIKIFVPEDVLVDTKTRAITILQLFEKNDKTPGHFTCLIMDRRFHRPGIFTFFDSERKLEAPRWHDLKTSLEAGGIVATTESIWIDATVPQQSTETNDCGIWMCLFVARFLGKLKELQEHHQVYHKVEIRLLQEQTTAEEFVDCKMVGQYGRCHIRESLLNKQVTKDCHVLALLDCVLE